MLGVCAQHSPRLGPYFNMHHAKTRRSQMNYREDQGRIGFTGRISKESGLYASACSHRTPIALSANDVFPPCQRGNHSVAWNLVIPASLLDSLEDLPDLGETIVDQWRRKHAPKPIPPPPLKPGESLLGRYLKQQATRHRTKVA